MMISKLTGEEKKALLKFARSAIESNLLKRTEAQRPQKISVDLEEKRGCFVTLHLDGALRGCIGTVEPVKPLIFCVQSNALNAAFSDPRFPSLTADELASVEIEISVLTVPEVLEYKDCEDLKRKLKPGVHGVILSRGASSATFLPQVWDQLPDKESFLECLCQKACMEKSAWMDRNTTVKIYEVEHFSEGDF
jgi:AmmeMemoRadiSam system protein A